MSRTVIEDRGGKLKISDIRPLADHLLVEVLENSKSSSGIVYPDDTKEISERLVARVVAVGPGEESPVDGNIRSLPFAVGDYILSAKYIGAMMELGGKKYRMIRAAPGVWAKLELLIREDGFDILAVHPMYDKVLVLPEDMNRTERGIYLPSNPQIHTSKGKVIAAGGGATFQRTGIVDAPHVREGDRIGWLRYAGMIVKMGRVEYRLLQEQDIVCVIEG